MTTPEPEPPSPPPSRRGGHSRAVLFGAGVVVAIALTTVAVLQVAKPIGQGRLAATNTPPIGTFSHHHVVIRLPTDPASYLGAFIKGNPTSYASMESFAAATGAHPNVALYYSGWYEKFQATFATHAKDNGAVPFIQIDPSGVRFRAIVKGVYDTYLETIATDVASYGAKTGQGVIIGFGHEMNGSWFPWGYRHVAPALFVAVWRHIVNVFRQQGADDVTWLWTVNVIDTRNGIPSPAPWWPGGSYVTWIGIDGYYLKPSWSFASLFGPTIKAVHGLTLDPILISETGAGQASGQPAKIANLFAGVRGYGLLGLVWFDSKGIQDFRLTSPAAFRAFGKGAKTFGRSSS